MHSRKFDIIILGGGLAGCATALSLVKSHPDATFLLIDNADPTHFKIGESLPAEAKRLLQYLSPQLLERLSSDTAAGSHVISSGTASAWAVPGLQETFSIMNPFGSGWHLDRAAFDESMRDQVRSLCSDQGSGGSMLMKGVFTSMHKDGAEWCVEARPNDEVLESETQRFTAKWLIDASGRKASAAHKLGAKTVKLDGLLAFYSVFASDSADPDRRTMIEATETGWWYTSQVGDNKRVVVFHTDDCDPAAKSARKQATFLDMLYQDTTYVSQVLSDCDYRLVQKPNGGYPICTAAGSSFLEPCGSEEDQWCAVGDAAIAFDPASSQGMITALRVGCSLGIMLSRKIPGSSGSAEPYGMHDVESLMKDIRTDYEKKKAYYYGQCMFTGDFWRRRCEPDV